jgi:UTP---glucose-1-phosphate uridylyltransferase
VLVATGAGDRLGLVCDETGEPLPAAMLPYCGRPMLSGLLRDLTAREYLYYRIFGEQHTTPVAIMTSDAKGNHRRVTEALQEHKYFARPKSSFRLFCQPLVPVLEACTGRWVLPEAMKPSMKPGGHGAIWKLMHDHGIFDWLADQGSNSYNCSPSLASARLCHHLVVRAEHSLVRMRTAVAVRPSSHFD